MKLHRAKDLTGSVFGRWKVLGFSHKRNKRYYWDCVCECGEKKSVDAIFRKTSRSNRKEDYAAIAAVKAYGMGDGSGFFKLHGEVKE